MVSHHHISWAVQTMKANQVYWYAIKKTNQHVPNKQINKQTNNYVDKVTHRIWGLGETGVGGRPVRAHVGADEQVGHDSFVQFGRSSAWV